MNRLIPSITNFGDESHNKGETGLVIEGAGLGPFPGKIFIYANSDRSGAQDQIVPTGGWSDMRVAGVDMPASPNNATGTVYLFIERSDLTMSLPYQFTLLSTAAPPVVVTGVSVFQVNFRRRRFA